MNLDGLGSADEGLPDDDRPPLAEQVAGSLRSAGRALFQPPRVYADRDEMVERRAAVNQRLPRPWVEHLVEHGSRPVEGGYVWKADPMFNVGLPGAFDLDTWRPSTRSPAARASSSPAASTTPGATSTTRRPPAASATSATAATSASTAPAS